jgi:hypothetical protein
MEQRSFRFLLPFLVLIVITVLIGGVGIILIMIEHVTNMNGAVWAALLISAAILGGGALAARGSGNAARSGGRPRPWF